MADHIHIQEEMLCVTQHRFLYILSQPDLNNEFSDCQHRFTQGYILLTFSSSSCIPLVYF